MQIDGSEFESGMLAIKTLFVSVINSIAALFMVMINSPLSAVRYWPYLAKRQTGVYNKR